MLKAIERGYVQQEIQNAAYEFQKQVDHQEAIVVGVNRFTVEEEKPIPIQHIDEALERRQVDRVRALRSRRDPGPWQAALNADRQRSPLRRQSYPAHCVGGRSFGNGGRNLRHAAQSLRGIQRSGSGLRFV